MSSPSLSLLLCFVVLVRASNPLSSSYYIDSSQTTVSGLSSGACMATQFHVAHSSEIMGVAVLAGCPFYCANGFVSLALACMDGVVNVPELLYATTIAESTFSIDATKNIKNDLVYLLSGTLDTVVDTAAVKAVGEYYEQFVDSTTQIKQNFTIPSVHGWPTNQEGSDCSDFGSPFVNNCTFSSSGDFLDFFYGPLEAPVFAVAQNLLPYDQSLYTLRIAPSSISMDETGFIYVPTSCQKGESCRLHIAFHGCSQGYSFVQDQFISKNQLNNWAESNHLIVLYPQVIATTVNPDGCWDWWSYTTAAYATKAGPQIQAVHSMMKALM